MCCEIFWVNFNCFLLSCNSFSSMQFKCKWILWKHNHVVRINCIPIHPKEGYIYNYSATLPYSHLDNMVTFVITKVVIVTGTPRFCHVRPLLFQLHWFPISYCIKFKILLLTFKCLCGLAPNYLIVLQVT